MVLNFSPPQDLINAYLSRPSPGQEASTGIQQALQMYVQQKALQKQQQSADSTQKIAKFNAVKDYLPEDQVPVAARAAGLDIPVAGVVPPTLSTGTLPTNTGMSPQGQPMTMAEPQQSLDQPAISPIVQASLNAGHPNHAGIQVPTSKAGLAKYKTNLETQKLTQGMDANEPASFDEVKIAFKAAGKPELADDLIKNAQVLGETTVQRKSMDSALRGLGVANTGIRGGAVDSMAKTRELALRDNLIKEARTTLDPYFQTGAGKQLALKFNRIAGAEPLLQQMLAQKDGGDTRQMRELGTSVANVITGGNVVAQNQVEEMIPQTYKGKLNVFLEKLKNNPTGLEQQAFIKRFAETIAREKTATQTQARAIAERNAPTLRVLKSQYPEDYQAVTDQYLNHSPEIMGTGSTTEIPKVGTIEDGHRFKGGNPANPSSWEQI